MAERRRKLAHNEETRRHPIRNRAISVAIRIAEHGGEGALASFGLFDILNGNTFRGSVELAVAATVAGTGIIIRKIRRNQAGAEGFEFGRFFGQREGFAAGSQVQEEILDAVREEGRTTGVTEGLFRALMLHLQARAMQELTQGAGLSSDNGHRTSGSTVYDRTTEDLGTDRYGRRLDRIGGQYL